MELVSPVTCLLAACSQPLTSASTSVLSGHPQWDLERISSLSLPRQILLFGFLLHYLNRSLLSTLRNPGRSPMHFSVPITASLFNLLNGYLIGTWIADRFPPSSDHLSTSSSSPSLLWAWTGFGICMAGWAIGLAQNIYHDEILYALRRSKSDVSHYGVPYGGLYSRPFGGVSSPHYLSELVEWTCFATASSITVKYLDPRGSPDHQFTPSPPWLFLLAELSVLIPRAIRNHQWYHQRFGDLIPKHRSALLPGLL